MASEQPQGPFLGPPGWTFHGLLLFAALAVWWATSVPGLLVFWAFVGGTIVILLASLWTIRIARVVTDRRRCSLSFLVAPLMLLLVWWSVSESWSLKLRWACNYEWVANGVDRPDLGSGLDLLPSMPFLRFHIADRWDVPGYGQFLKEEEQAGWPRRTDAGFAYLPNGVAEDSLVQYVELSDDWYAWTAIR
jgi:hypothetical protein